MINIPYSEGMNYGLGINTLNGSVLGNGVDEGAITEPTNAKGQNVSRNLTKIDTYESIEKTLGISAEANVQYGIFSAEGKFKFTKQCSFNSHSTFLLLHCVVENPFSQCEDAQLKAKAAELLEKADFDSFNDIYGDSFVRGIRTGGEFYAVISITDTTLESQQAVAAALEASFLGFGSSKGKFNSSEHNKSGKLKIQITSYQAGGSGSEETKPVESIDEAITRSHDFPSIILKNPVPISVQVASYKTLGIKMPSSEMLEKKRKVLKEISKLKSDYEILINDMNFAVENQDFFQTTHSPKQYKDWAKFFAKELDAIIESASDCLSNIDKCMIPDGLHFPEDFDYNYFERRKLTEVTATKTVEAKAAPLFYKNILKLKTIKK